ncbi:hypothetical protein VFPPC_13387 [Pochonia chlamydosporia 170]|uniref:Uncharacterized protein n=1 Tax=Pochonia chlamydosporia 170 TaxID=1380566 RepID=A0A179FYB4_METCM|nr:hypothetical protein VFPPC_13387 [Pochonia chlamydosporia 170]OAQ70634.1 hypothetical protein VFPPC_13387 [Pochonia chlamydosporia 170]
MPERKSTPGSINTETSSIPQIEVMSPPRDRKPKRVPRDTGFPEPFQSGPNTTLPHPDADLSPNAMLSYEDVSQDRMIKRHRLSFLKKHKRTVSHGVIKPETEAFNSMLSLSMLDFDGKHGHQLRSVSTTSLRLSKDGGESIRSSSKREGDDDTPPTSPDVPEHRRKPGLFGRFKRP